MTAETQEKPLEADRVLSRAVLRAGEQLGLSRRELAAAIGVSEATMSRLARGRGRIQPTSKEGELSLLVVRVFRSLDALVGGDGDKARAWLRAPNDHLTAAPVELIGSVLGLVGVVEYLDALRG